MNSQPLRTINRKKLVNEVIETLQQSISLGHLPLHSRIPIESELMEQLGVGRSTLREAIRVLVHAGLLEVRQGDGTYVISQFTDSEPLHIRLKRASILEVYEVRRILEIEIARLAARNRDEDDISKMELYLQQRQQSYQQKDRASFLQADVSFHLTIAASSKNAVLTDLYHTLSTVLHDTLENLITDPQRHDDQHLLHVELFEAIRDKDEIRAETITKQFLQNTMDHFQRLLR